MHGLLLEMYDGTEYTDEKIIRQFTEEVFKKAKSEGFIELFGKNRLGIDIYRITDKGKQYCAKNEGEIK